MYRIYMQVYSKRVALNAPVTFNLVGTDKELDDTAFTPATPHSPPPSADTPSITQSKSTKKKASKKGSANKENTSKMRKAAGELPFPLNTYLQ